MSYDIQTGSFLIQSMRGKLLTSSIITLVWAADRQNLALDSMIGVAGNPTTTVATPRFNISRPNALKYNVKSQYDSVYISKITCHIQVHVYTQHKRL